MQTGSQDNDLSEEQKENEEENAELRLSIKAERVQKEYDKKENYLLGASPSNSELQNHFWQAATDIETISTRETLNPYYNAEGFNEQVDFVNQSKINSPNTSGSVATQEISSLKYASKET